MREPLNQPDELFLADLAALLDQDVEVPEGLVRRLTEGTLRSATTETPVSKTQATVIACLVFLIAAKVSVAPFSIMPAILGAGAAGLYGAFLRLVVGRQMSGT